MERELAEQMAGVWFSVHGPFGPRPSVKDTCWPSRRVLKLTPWTLEGVEESILSLPRIDKPKALVGQLLDRAFGHASLLPERE